MVLVKPDASLSTPTVYKAWDAQTVHFHPDIKAMCTALRAGNLTEIAGAMGNSLQSVSEQICPAVGEVRRALTAAGAPGAVMTGSGAAVVSLWQDIPSAEKACRQMQARGWWAVVATPEKKFKLDE